MDARIEVRPGRAGTRRSRNRGRNAVALLALTLLGLTGCRGAGETTDMMVPRSWKGNPWGPDANAAREDGRLPRIPYNPEMTAWEDWGRKELRDGDILVRMGDARAVMGLFPFSKVSAAIAGSRFSHSGIVAIEDGKPVVYDTTTTGPQRQPFAIWLLDTRGSFAIKRPRDEYQALVPKAVAYCREAYLAQTPFDKDMKMGADKLYCIELTELAYRSAGLPLSEPLQLQHLPRYGEFPKIVRLMRRFTAMEPDQLAYVIGNEKIGIWSSPALDLVYDAPDARPPGEAESSASMMAREKAKTKVR